MKKSPHSLWDCVVMFFYPPPSLRDTSASGGHEKKKPRRGHPPGACVVQKSQMTGLEAQGQLVGNHVVVIRVCCAAGSLEVITGKEIPEP